MNSDFSHISLPNNFPSLSKTEINSLFLNTLADVYNMKVNFLSYLPLMAEKVSYPKLKMAVLDTALEVEAQRLRISLIFRILKYENNVRPEALKGHLDIEGYIRANLDELASYKTDFVLFSHLLMIENMEVTYFKVLKMLALNIHHRDIYLLIRQCLQEALRKRRIFEVIGAMYRIQTAD